MLNLWKSKNKTGFTLVEAMVSILLLGISAGAMVGVFTICRTNATKAMHYIEATNHVRAAMEQLVTDYTVTPALPNGTIKDLGGSYSIAITDYAAGVKEITVALSWNERLLGGGSKQVSTQLVTLTRKQ